ncbi:hypothetical protein ACUOA5_12615, partial [Escherichia coli]
MPYKVTGAGSAQGAANRRRPLHPQALASKSPKRSLEAGATRMDARRGRILQGRYLAPDPVAARDKLREPRSGDFVRQSLGVQGAAAIG